MINKKESGRGAGSLLYKREVYEDDGWRLEFLELEFWSLIPYLCDLGKFLILPVCQYSTGLVSLNFTSLDFTDTVFFTN